jgi:hypothetical protein
MLTATREFGYGNGPSRKYRLGGDMDFQLAVLAGVLGVLLTYVVTWLHERLRPNVASLEPVQERVDRLTGTLGDAMRALAATSEELQQEVDRAGSSWPSSRPTPAPMRSWPGSIGPRPKQLPPWCGVSLKARDGARSGSSS